MDIKILEKVVNKKYSLPKLLKRLNPDNHYEYGRPCFCPFHDNTRTPAAVIYNDEDGDNLWCYAENRMYKSTDVLEKFYKQDIYEIGGLLYEGLSDSEKIELEKGFDYIKAFSKDINIDDKKSKKLDMLCNAYKESDITLNEYLNAYIYMINE